jgi:recombination protein RecA
MAAKKTKTRAKSAQEKKREEQASIPKEGTTTEIRDALNKQFGTTVAPVIVEKPPVVVPTGILSMDLAVGNCGLLGGRIMDIHGWEGTGKTLLCLTIAGYIQKCSKVNHKNEVVPKQAAFLDAEGTFSKAFAESAGVNTDELILVESTPEELLSGEKYFDAMFLCLKMGVDYIILDSCPALIPDQVMINEMDQGQKAPEAQLLSRGIKIATGRASSNGTSLVHFINQKRSKPMAQKWERNEIETGGNALKFYSSYRFDVVSHEDIIKKVLGVDGQYRAKKVGVNSRVRIIKNKTAPIPSELPSKNYHFDFDVYFEDFIDDEKIEYRRGVDVAKDFMETGIRTGVVKQSSSWFSFSTINANGRPAFVKALKEQPAIMGEIRDEVFAKMGIAPTAIEPTEEEAA